MTHGRRRAVIELLIAAAAAAACVASWITARATVIVAPVLPGQPETTSVAYSPAMLAVAFVFASVAGVLAVLGAARLRRSG